MNPVISIEARRESLARFLGAVEGTSLYVLRVIEQTVAALATERKLMDALAEAASALTAGIRSDKPVVGSLFDPDDAVISGFEKAYRLLEANLPRIVRKKAAIDGDTQLQEHHCEELHAAYDTNIEAIANLIEAMKDLRAAVIAHDLAAEGEPSERFDDVSSLVASLRDDAID